jgi:hypothetical protein
VARATATLPPYSCVGLTQLTLSHADVAQAGAMLAEIIDIKEYLKPEFSERRAVT